jgi:hypothetical protein
MSERQAPWWANQPAPEMTRSERARWTDLQVLAYLWVVDNEDVVTAHEPLTTREVAAALGVSVGRAAHSLRRMWEAEFVKRDEAGWYTAKGGEVELLRAWFDIGPRLPIAYPRDNVAA